MIVNSADCRIWDVIHLLESRLQINPMKPCHAAFLRQVGNLSLHIEVIKP